MKIPKPLFNAYSWLYANQPDLMSAAMDAAIEMKMTDDPNVRAFIKGRMAVFGLPFMGAMNHVDQAFIMAHEMWHYLLGHRFILKEWMLASEVTGQIQKHLPERTVPFVMRIAQKAFDINVNDALLRSGFEAVPGDGWHAPYLGVWTDRECDIYLRCYAHEELQGGEAPSEQPPSGQAPGCGGPEDVIPADADEQPDPADVQTIKDFVQSLVSNPHMRGVTAADGKLLLERLAPLPINWIRRLHPRLTAAVGWGSRTFYPPQRSLFSLGIYQEGNISKRTGWVVVVADTSGSMSQRDLSHSLAALGSMIEAIQPKRVSLLEVDVRLHRVTEFTEPSQFKPYTAKVVTSQGWKGGGGTRLTEGFRWIEEQKDAPDICVVFTDMGTNFPATKGKCKQLVWCCVNEFVAPAHLGETIRIC
jgi:hypothetical protein